MHTIFIYKPDFKFWSTPYYFFPLLMWSNFPRIPSWHFYKYERYNRVVFGLISPRTLSIEAKTTILPEILSLFWSIYIYIFFTLFVWKATVQKKISSICFSTPQTPVLKSGTTWLARTQLQKPSPDISQGWQQKNAVSEAEAFKYGNTVIPSSSITWLPHRWNHKPVKPSALLFCSMQLIKT